MAKFVGRQRELAELNDVLAQGGSQFILVYGRRLSRVVGLRPSAVLQCRKPVTTLESDKPGDLRFIQNPPSDRILRTGYHRVYQKIVALWSTVALR